MKFQPQVLRENFKRALFRRRHFLPNSLTIANMFCGFLASVYAAAGKFDKAAIVIGLGILLDGLDGRVARRLNATSKFGSEFDSFADLVSFGIAPAILVYHWAFKSVADEFGVIICFVYVICAASRLARFNIAAPNPHGFTGLPSPGAAGMVAAVVHLSPSQVGGSFWLALSGTLLMLTCGSLMISQLKYYKPRLHRRAMPNLLGVIFVGAVIALTWYRDQLGFLLLALVYVLSAPIAAVYQALRVGYLKFSFVTDGQKERKEDDLLVGKKNFLEKDKNQLKEILQ
ncbi:MAG TPA: CDP-diacylglycerol--serine O-phosphatidyltransferase [Oligoflexia bacterium]|nr:CDP-diacylglycerol--serine O-phosphatidyltransferase [Oligoflexia bacterium]HMP27022.1 CDP-diacylglycerol--serine O-phosphatidyltransferase [Oligoflexia bacterium]